MTLSRTGRLIPLLVAAGVGGLLWWLLPPPPRAALPAAGAAPSRCIRVSFAPDGRCVATWHFPPINQNGPCTLRLWDVATGQLQATLHHGDRQLESIAFSPDGQRVAVRWFDRGIQVWQRDGREIAEYRPAAWHEWNPHLQVVYTADQRLLAYGPDPSSGQLWDVLTGREVRRLFPADQAFGTVMGGYEGFIVTYRDQRVQTWHLATAELRSTFVSDELSGLFALSDDGRTLASFVRHFDGFDRRLRVQKADGTEHDLGLIPGASAVALSPDGRGVTVVVGDPSEVHPLLVWLRQFVSGPGNPTGPRSELQIIDVASGRRLANLDRADGAKFAPDGTTLAVTAQDGTVYLYDWPLRPPWLRIAGGTALAVSAAAACQALIGAWRRRRLRRRDATSRDPGNARVGSLERVPDHPGP